MFRVGQVITTTMLLTKFKIVADFIANQPEPVLITQRSGEPLVLLSSRFYEELMRRDAMAHGHEVPESSLRDLLEPVPKQQQVSES